ncbi:MAG: glycosyltransferase, partial [Proteobacteria bacterium]
MASSAKNHEFREQLETQGIRTAIIEMNHSSFDQFLLHEQFELCVFDRFMVEEQFGARVASALPRCLRILDTIDLHFLRRTRELNLKGKLGQGELDEETCTRELASIYRSDLTLVLSRYEVDLLVQEFGVPSQLLAEWGFMYAIPEAETLPTAEGRKHFAWIGNFRHPPNEDAVRFCLKEFLPRHWAEIRAAYPDLEIHFYGAYPPKELMALDQPKKGIRVLGPCDDSIKTLKKYRALFAPIRYGAGIKGKISDSWAAGLPVITTDIGAEGMSAPGEPFAGLLVKTEIDMQKALIRLAADDTEFNALQTEGLRALTELYGESLQIHRLREWIQKLTERPRPWIQKILWHQHHRSTDFFSRWIEE